MSEISREAKRLLANACRGFPDDGDELLTLITSLEKENAELKKDRERLMRVEEVVSDYAKPAPRGMVKDMSQVSMLSMMRISDILVEKDSQNGAGVEYE